MCIVRFGGWGAGGRRGCLSVSAGSLMMGLACADGGRRGCLSVSSGSLRLGLLVPTADAWVLFRVVRFFFFFLSRLWLLGDGVGLWRPPAAHPGLWRTFSDREHVLVFRFFFTMRGFSTSVR